MPRRSLIVRRFTVTLCALGAVLVSAAALQAHDFWLVPDAFRVAPGQWLQIRGQTSSAFPTSEAAVALDRIADARVLDASRELPLEDFSHAGTSLLIRHRPTSPGQRIIAIRLHPRFVRESPESFRRYLLLEGAPEALERYEREGRLPSTDSITRSYAKYAKTLVEVGRDGERAFSRVAGHPLEFVPLGDPSTLRAGQTLPVRLLYRGRPLGGAVLHAGVATGGEASTDVHDQTLRTSSEGVVEVPITRSGVWNLRMLHIVPAEPGSSADWDVHWATLVFQVPTA